MVGKRVRIINSDEQSLIHSVGRLATVLRTGPICILNVDEIGIRGCVDNLIEPVLGEESFSVKIEDEEMV